MQRGEIWHVDLEPTLEREQRGKRFVFILSPALFNKLGTPVVLPITQGGDFMRLQGFAVSLMNTGLKTQGVIICAQPRSIDMVARNGKLIEKAPPDIIAEVLARARVIFE